MSNTRQFIELYMSALRNVVHKPIPTPKIGSKRYLALERAREVVDSLRGDYADYIRVQFEAYRYMSASAYPKPEHLYSVKAIQRYEGWRRLKNKYLEAGYTVDGDYLIVNSTYKTYPLLQVISDTSSDSVASFAQVACKQVLEKTPEELLRLPPESIKEMYEAVEYLFAKLAYKQKKATNTLMEGRRLISELYTTVKTTFLGERSTS